MPNTNTPRPEPQSRRYSGLFNDCVRIGAPPAFATTQPRGAVIMGGTTSPRTGVAPAGAITTSGAIFASDTVVRKIIADGTASNVET